jgi:hypothetical protein
VIPGNLCRRCGQAQAIDGAVWTPFWLAAVVLFGGMVESPRWCKDCGAGINLLGGLLTGAVLAVLFVVLVIAW